MPRPFSRQSPLVNSSDPAANLAVPAALSARGLLALAGFFIVLRLGFFPLGDPIVDEAYYWLYSQRMELAFLDHPPLVAWLDWLGTRLLGNTPAGVRLGAIICGGLALVYVYRLALAVDGGPLPVTASTVIDAASTPWKVLRDGPVDGEEVLAVAASRRR